MRQTILQKKQQKICTDTREGWRLWRTIDDAGTVEYVLAAQSSSAHTLRVLAQAVAALLGEMPAAVALAGREDGGAIANEAAAQLGSLLPDGRVMTRAECKVFVAQLDRAVPVSVVERLLAVVRERHNAGVRFAASRVSPLSEGCFADLLDGRADLELTFSGRSTLRIRPHKDTFDANELWARLRASWLDVIAS